MRYPHLQKFVRTQPDFAPSIASADIDELEKFRLCWNGPIIGGTFLASVHFFGFCRKLIFFVFRKYHEDFRFGSKERELIWKSIFYICKSGKHKWTELKLHKRSQLYRNGKHGLAWFHLFAVNLDKLLISVYYTRNRYSRNHRNRW